MRKASLSARLLCFLLLGGLLPVAALAVFTSWYVQVRLYDRLGQQLRIAAEEARDTVDRDMLERYRDLKSLADDPALAASPASVVAAFLRTAPPEGAGFSRRSDRCLQVLASDGKAVFETGECEAAGGWIRPSGAASGPYFAGTRALANGTPVTDVSLPIGASGLNSYELRATLDLRSLSDLLVREKFPGGLGMDVVVYTPDGRIVATKNGVAAGALADEFPVLAALSGEAAGSREGGGARGTPALAAANTLAGLAPPLEALKWKVAVVQPLDDLSEPTVILLRQLRRWIAAVALLAALASALCWALLFPGAESSGA